ncbi:hypothetical protein G7077_05085 [Sphingomonas piscis]|uniref:Uncharacterized protein n=1 Tax=Sphingomonas piscis TaxID=2714943 RepID=A0A6G7YNQ4_9SPHN|nr:hypothetical protein [Sphingomonas piscis]QIK78372.1 hypothetical protein G7077_05085 [Sphingomonas piscis]
MMTLDAIVAAISEIDFDHAMAEALAHRLKSAAPNFASKMVPRRQLSARNFPPVNSILAAQCSVFDNWIEFGGKRPKRGEIGHYRDRFKAELQVWTCTKDDIDWDRSSWHGKAHLWSGKDVMARSKGKSMKLPKALSEDFRAQFIELASGMDGFRLGLPYTKDGKTLLYNNDGSYLAARETELQDHQLELMILATSSGPFCFSGFKNTTSKGHPLSGNCFAHSRMTTSKPLADKWDATLFSHQPATSRDEARPAEG